MAVAKTVLLFCLGAIVAYVLQDYIVKKQMGGVDPSKLLTSLNTLSLHSVADKITHKVAIGYNSNVDLISSAIDMMEEMVSKFDHVIPPSDRQSDVELLNSFDDLGRCFEHFYRTASGAERFVSNKTLFEEVVHAGTSERLLDKSHFSIGGNAALMAGKFARDGWDVLLTGAIGPKMKELLAPYPSITFSNEDPADEFHVIMEYKTTSVWNGHSPPRANRFIVTRDEANTGFLSLDAFHEQILSFKPDLLVLSGFHLLDGVSDEHTRRSRMKAVAKKVEESRKHLGKKLSMTHVELASIGNRRIYEEISQIVFPVVNSLGLNEQELSVLYQVLSAQGKAHNELSGDLKIAQTSPDLNSVIHAISYIMKEHSTLKRVHFHSLVFHLLAVVEDENACDASLWAAITASSLTATEQACGFEKNWSDLNLVDLLFDPTKQDLGKGIQVENRDGVLSWKQSYSFNTLHLRFYLAPVLVCKQVRHTVGLGDAISSAGLSQQVRVQKSDLCIH
jgi:ADP-dependent glucokinase